jgi:L-lactate dehydrogenase (cytochrome)
MTVITTIEDLRVLAQKRVPRMFYDYADSGSGPRAPTAPTRATSRSIKLRQRVAVNMENRSTATTMVGRTRRRCRWPSRPVGLTGMQHADGEIHGGRAAEKFGIPFTLSTMSICSIEDIAAEHQPPFWFQLYMMRDRDAMARMIDRCKAAKCSALVLTLDLQVIGQRHKDLKNGLTRRRGPRCATSSTWPPSRAGAWACWHARHTFGNLVGHVKGVSDMSSAGRLDQRAVRPAPELGRREWVKQRWGGKLILKGIMDVEDAKLAVASGADAIVVSNHGGRQLDGAPSASSALPAIVAAVGSQIEVWMDGGIRRARTCSRPGPWARAAP